MRACLTGICAAAAQTRHHQGVTTINDDVDRSTSESHQRNDLEHYAADLKAGLPAAHACLEDAYLMLWRRHTRTLADLDAAQILLANRAAPLIAHRHAGPAMPPEVETAMGARSGHMQPVVASIDGQRLVLVLPPGGVDDPQAVWQGLRKQYRRDR